MIKAVIFDMFETLVSLYRCEQYFGEHIGMKPLQALWYLKENTRSTRGHNPEFARLEEPGDVLRYL